MARYSLRTLLVFTLMMAVIAAVVRPGPHPVAQVRVILNRDLSNSQKLGKLASFVRIGENVRLVNQRLDTLPDIDGGGVGFYDCYYVECGLHLCCYPDGVIYAVGYNPLPAVASDFQWLYHPGIVSWPPLTDAIK